MRIYSRQSGAVCSCGLLREVSEIMVQSLLDLPDATLSEILRLLPTGRQLLNALESSRQLQALVAADPPFGSLWRQLMNGW